MLNGETEAPDWRPCHHQGQHGGWNTCCSSSVSVEPQTNPEDCKEESSEPEEMQKCPCKFYIEQAIKEMSSNMEANQTEYLKGLSNTITSVMEGLGNSFWIGPL